MSEEARQRRRLGAATWAMIVGVVAGFAAGVFIGPPMVEVAILGDLFLLALRMLIVPLVFASLVTGVAAMGALRGLGRAATAMVVYSLGTMLLAVTLGLVLVTTIEPGVGVAAAPAELSTTLHLRAEQGTWAAVKDMLRTFLSPNVFTALSSDPPGILAVITFALTLGAVLGTMGERARPVVALFEIVDEALSRMVRLVILAAPVGVFALIAARLGAAGGGAAALSQLRGLGLYVVTVIVGLVIHGFVVLPLVLRWFGGRRPLTYARGMVPALLTAFSTASSSASLPVTLECVTTGNGVSARAARFVAPLGATLNMNGTALYEAVAAVFIAQTYGIHLGPLQLVLVAVTATLAAIGASGIPEAGLVTMLIVLAAVGLPAEGVGLILAVDWFLDRCRTTVNVWDDGVGAAVVERQAHL